MNGEKNFFLYIMEAETELPAFDSGEITDTSVESPPDDSATPSSDSVADENPPDLAMDDDTGSSFTGDEGGMGMGGDESDTAETDEGETKEDQSMSEKANNLLNQKLYEQLCARNDEIDNIIDSLQKLTPILPHEFVEENEKYISQIKATLNKSKDYAITKFVDAKYGENLLFFNEINLLFTMLCDELDKNLKRNFKK